MNWHYRRSSVPLDNTKQVCHYIFKKIRQKFTALVFYPYLCKRYDKKAITILQYRFRRFSGLMSAKPHHAELYH